MLYCFDFYMLHQLWAASYAGRTTFVVTLSVCIMYVGMYMGCSLPNKSSPGHDRISYCDIKTCLAQSLPQLVSIYNTCIANCKVPDDWKKATIRLIPKANNDSRDLSEWRPISLLVTFYKLFMKLMERRIIPWIVDTNRLSDKQKGSMPRNGLQEHVFCLKNSITDFRHQSGKLFVTFIDLADAFGSINHDFMIDLLKIYGYPEKIVKLRGTVPLTNFLTVYAYLSKIITHWWQIRYVSYR